MLLQLLQLMLQACVQQWLHLPHPTETVQEEQWLNFSMDDISETSN